MTDNEVKMAKKKQKQISSDAKFNKKLTWGVVICCAAFFALAVFAALWRSGVIKFDFTPKEVKVDYALPPVRTGAQTLPAQTESMALEDAVKASDAILLIRVGDWLGETDTQTLYECTVLEKIKGNAGKKFVLVQEGSSKATVEDYPLLTGGNELLAFLKGSDLENPLIPKRQKAYELVGGSSMLMYTCSVTSEGRFVTVRDSSWYERMPSDVLNMGNFKYYPSAVYPKLAEVDSIFKDYDPETDLIYRYDKLADKIRSMD